MFDLDKAIAAWRRRLEHRQAFSAEDVRELEGHVRDFVEAHAAKGMAEEEAFRRAVSRMGAMEAIEAEYEKTYWSRVRHRRVLGHALIQEGTMLTSYLKTALRNVARYRAYAVLNVAGLALGLACCLLILLFVRHEWSVDAFHTRADRLYRLCKVVTPPEGGEERHALSSGRMGPALAADFPEVEQAVRLMPWFDPVLMTRGATSSKVADVLIADSTFFEVFDFRLLRGDPAEVLRAPMSVVLTETTARRFFGASDPVGQVLVGLFGEAFTVTGVAADAPEASHLRYEALVSWSSTVPGQGALDMGWMNNWMTQTAFTYLLLAPGADAAVLSGKLPGFMARHFPERAAQYHLYLQPFRDVYLASTDIQYNNGVRLGDATYLYAFSTIALFILVIACINFINLSTARAARRAKEVGVRKVLGAHRRQLVGQFLGDALLVCLVALTLALGLVAAVLPAFARLSERALSLAVLDPALLFAGLPLLVAGVVLGSGLYPAVLLSGYRPIQVLKSGWTGRRHGLGLRRILVTTQFVLSTALIAGTLVVGQQMRYLQRHDLGFDREHLLTLPIGGTRIAEQYDAFKAAVLQHPNVVRAAGSQGGPGLGTMGFGLRPEGKPESDAWGAPTIRIDDDDFLETFGLEMAEGRFFDDARPADATHGVVINETLARTLGWAEPVGKRLGVRGEVEEGTVIGVVKDFHVQSLHQAIEPLVIVKVPRHGDLTLRLTGDDLPGTIAFLKATWEAFEQQYPFEYRFLDETFASYYDTEQRMRTILGLFAGLAILVACLGLFGLTAFTAEQRTKEIGVRKVMGASVPGLVALLSKDVVRLVALAFVVAVPAAAFALHRWLETFAYRIDLSPWTFVLAGLATAALALATVGYHALRAALTDPARALRYE